MSNQPPIPILPYSRLVGQEQLKLALELVYIAPRIGGVLIKGQRGTGKTTAVRAFAQMMQVPPNPQLVNLPINATEDRVIGGWQIDQLMRGAAVPQKGLLEEANNSLLYVDEVNLLDDQIVNIILDATATGKLVIQREGRAETLDVSFTLVGTMNPEEGGLRPQLLDRFGLVVQVNPETDPQRRRNIIQTVIEFDKAVYNLREGKTSDWLEAGLEEDRQYRKKLERARKDYRKLHVFADDRLLNLCIALTQAFSAVGHRGDYVLALAAQALAAREKAAQVEPQHLQQVARLVLEHRRKAAGLSADWTTAEDKLVDETIWKATNHA